MKTIYLLLVTIVCVSANVVSQTFTEIGSGTLTGVHSGATVFGDLDNDGDLDVIITGALAPFLQSLKIYLNNGLGDFTVISDNVLPGVEDGAIVMGDLDGDGDLDFILTGYSGSGLISKIYFNNGSGVFTETGAGSLDVLIGSFVLLGDLDGDGDLDLIGSKIYLNNGFGEFAEAGAGSLPYVGGGSASIGDLDGDGDLDLVMNGVVASTQVSKIFLNNGSGEFFESIENSLIGMYNGTTSLGDLDGDGDLDLIQTGSSSSVAISKIYLNNGSGIFTETGAGTLTGVWLSSTSLGDLDNDGDLDLILSGSDGSNRITKLYLNNGLGEFSETGEGSVMGAAGSSLALGDIDSDGDLDLILTGSNPTPTSKIYRNSVFNVNKKPFVLTGLFAQQNDSLVQLSWNAGIDDRTNANLLRYAVFIGTSPTGGYKINPMSNLTSGYRMLGDTAPFITSQESLTIKNLAPGTYYWTVQAIDTAYKGGQFAPMQSFTVVTTPAQVTLIAPADSATSVAINPTLTWNTASGAATYELDIATNNGFTTGLQQFTGLAETSKVLTGLSNGQTYYWRVRAVNAGGNGEWSDVRTFTTVPAIPTIYANVVPNGFLWGRTKVYIKTTSGTSHANNLSLRIDTDTTDYAIMEIGTDFTTFQSGPVFNDYKFSDGNHSIYVRYIGAVVSTLNITTGQLYNNATIRYNNLAMKVKSGNGGFMIYAPEGKEVTRSDVRMGEPFAIELEHKGAALLELQNPHGETGVLMQYVDGTWKMIACSKPVFFIKDSGTYAIGNDTMFSMVPKIKNTLIEQNYPNPFNPETDIPYTVAESGKVIMRIFDVKGREVVTLVNDYKERGMYNAHWNGKDFRGKDMPSGVYYSVLEVNGTRMVKKMVMLK